MKKTMKVLPLIIIVAVMLIMPVYAADLETSINNVVVFVRGIAGGIIEIATIAACVALLAKRAKWGAVGTFIFGSAFAAAVAMPDLFKSIGEGIAKLL